MSMGQDEHLLAMQVEWVVPLVEILQDHVYYLHALRTDNELVLLLEGFVVHALDVECFVTRAEPIYKPVQSRGLQLWPEGTLVQEPPF